MTIKFKQISLLLALVIVIAAMLWQFYPVTENAAVQETQRESFPTKAGDVDGLILDLAARLKDNPNDVEGWQMLGWSYFNTENYDLAAEAYGKSVELDASDPDVLSAYGESLVRSKGGMVNDRALEIFDSVLVLNPTDPRARFFQGMALEQAGNSDDAIEIWLTILEDAPADAGWLAGLQGRVLELAASTGFDLGDRLDAFASSAVAISPQINTNSNRGPTQIQIDAAQNMSEQDRQAMIQGMVDQLADRLQENPDDAEGWARLIKSRVVLGDEQSALSDYLRATELFADTPEKLALITNAASELSGSSD